ncbi:hypothetical protein GCM10023189_04170 [Nibrella saemangeumensis]|uniref:GAF domain-containing protein n=1 Tax=Nibrella saemangeumensis TaxID=1084526 RepID=A0ABP8MB04_9BACT
MKIAPLPGNEISRLKALAEYELLDTLPEQVYDDITLIASEITGTPIALLSLVDENRQWFKSRQGLDVQETPREYSFCAHAILDPNEMMVVEDARHDERFYDNPLTTGHPHIVFYAGVPIVDAGGHAMGSLCVIDSQPRKLPESKRRALKALANVVKAQFEQRKTRLDMDRVHQALKAATPASRSQPTVSARAHRLIEEIESGLLSLSAGSFRTEHASQLASLQQALHDLKGDLNNTDQ